MSEKIEHFIHCPKFGGTRFAPTCIHFDRYKTCRRTCKSLEKHIVEFPNLTDILKESLQKLAEKKKVEQYEFFSSAKFSGKHLPDAVLSCKYCKFVAKSERGLRIHYKRTHKTALPS